MKSWWSPQHAALLESLRAQALIPRLYARLSLERYTASEDDLRRLMAWPSTLMQQTGWALIEPALDHVDAWPETWHLATEMGFEPVADHHHALLFGRLTLRLIKDQEYDQATWTWTECISSWRRLACSDYLTNLLQDIAQPVEEDDPEDNSYTPLHEEVVTHLLDHLIEHHEHNLNDAIRLLDADRSRRTDIDYRLAKFSWSALAATLLLMQEISEDDLERFPISTSMCTQAHRRVAQFKTTLRRQVMEVFEKDYAQIDLNDDDSIQLLSSFSWIARCAELIGRDTEMSTLVVTSAVELGWKLRRTGREEEGDDFERMLMMCTPFHKFLMRQLAQHTVVGPNSKCADFLVFQGESSNDHEHRKQRFERAIEICPGHRNASLMLSYEHLHLANQALHAISLIPAPLKHLPVGERPKMLWRTANKHVEEARTIYPFNERLEDYQERLDKAAQRMRITPTSTDE